MNSLERVLTTLGHKEPDRVPLFLLANMHGAKELGLPLRDYYQSAENVIEGEIRVLDKFGSDCAYPFYYASIEVEAWGGDTIFSDDGPPLCGAPVIREPGEIDRLQTPDVASSPALQRVLKTISGIRQRLMGQVPIVAVAISPFSLPVMQMGFDRYIDLIHEQPDRFNRLMQVNEEFTVAWANAQLAAGATAICYFDPVSSTTNIPRKLYLHTGQQVAKRTLARIKGPTATHMASGRCLPILGDIADTGTAVVGVSILEDLAGLKAAAAGRVSLLGNLNGIEMRRWSPAEAELAVKRAIAAAGPGGGFILGDNHGEIPFQVTDETLLAIREAVDRWGRYPLEWVRDWTDPGPG
jgi:uroporphyrinogen decarboxylase